MNLGSYWIYHNSTIETCEDELDKNPENKIWRVVKHCKLKNKDINGYILNQGDLIRIGRVRFKVREIESPVYAKIRQLRLQKQRRDDKIRRSNATNRGSSAKKNSIDLTDLDPVNADLPVSSDF